MRSDLGEEPGVHRRSGMPLLHRVAMPKIGRTEVHRQSSKHRGAYKNIKGRTLRVSTLGRTFLDMLRNPELCGGMHHVIEVYEEYAETYQRLIVDEIEQHGAPIDKVRAGYLLDKRVKLKNPTVESWVRFAQRGGSRKLDASAEYAPRWSDKWCLSLNIEGLEGDGAP
jgi:predicted transcriptional regulator of viral defense system